MTSLENTPFDELEVGMTATFSKTVSEEDIKLFAILSGDTNPIHLDEEYAKTTPFGGCIAHGAICAIIISAAVATQFPGPGSIYAGQEMRFKKPVRPGDTLTAHLELLEKKRRGNIVLIDNVIKNQHGETVFLGVSTVVAPSEKVIAKPVTLPKVELYN
ncbi:MAG: 3-hydroxybutyryl-CoA dehydratase [Pseudomonadales bacterium]|jgi:acyl dehydratase|uniref:MaoC/PaaZ C-terminal domain-containing protein n=1 Tax=unclassified Ketobacter TaxID=2639109 RepID=UPI000C94D798|nr:MULTISPECIES: MaoC/PaaZ C-terminal domain-containing protein [unclassified Ketobacter]MAA60199.1 3-hydroxybutyryl-CoA dehydratase [Pseudomonadales bacterium]MEC8809880.1 MaoC/PaaZ C-terminal domain-containing protein [Pseudomonadota bacterium]TNC84664.1 MAG: 3-hydroxybutyryl-CoA dehydratase [Alcanivorax sp.]HAG95038.1 3-hydroxybutyryl-CoA dehydratase [Gammaproteobacteria bacterium]MAQ25717.1 3-hydroxybutyryl-CoA dehydratase [Pseudomonadales bacterium]|tara:strand:+ start:155 stop:631 length:477 start_codon:yes stop_codon:yes gene_type:complete